AAARAAEFERRRKALHAALTQQEQELRNQVEAVDTESRAAAERAEARRIREQELHRQLEAEPLTLSRIQDDLAGKRQALAQTAQPPAAPQAQMAGLTAQLVELERTLENLKAARQRQQQTYSLVPYRGKRGDARRPLYIECTRRGLLFHPDK